VRDKYYYFDVGVYRSIRPSRPLDRPDEIERMALEGLVAQHLRAWAAWGGGEEQLYYWRTKSGTEVDFITYGPNEFVALEIKRAARIHGSDLRALSFTTVLTLNPSPFTFHA
jgi:predicted AAA+ superfamily ATPase